MPRLPRSTRIAASLALVLSLTGPASTGLAAQGLPYSTDLLYVEEKNFQVGDWVSYRIDAVNHEGETTTDYQRLQVVSEVVFRGEPCFWLETGWGQSPDRLSWTTVLMSEYIFEDSLAEARADVHMRRMHSSTAPDGTPIVSDTRQPPPAQTESGLLELLPKRTRVGTDTVVVEGRRFVCEVWESVLERAQIDEMPDSSVRYLTTTTRRRWIDPSLPITALVKEVERQERYRHAWPLGQLSGDFPRQLVEFYELNIQMVGFGAGAKPMVSDRVKHMSDPSVARQRGTP